MNNKNNQKGYILLLSTIILGVVGLAVSLFVFSTGLINSQNSFTIENSHKALSLAEACVESALQEIKDSTSFSGSGNITIDNKLCNYEVFNQGGQNRRIETYSTVNSVTKKIEVEIDRINPSINIILWNETADF